jgi:phage terminase large subunit
LETENKYKYTKAYFKIKELILNNPDEDVFVICGGQGASKTVSIIQLIIQSLLSSEKEATVLSSELSKMKRTVIRDYKKICKDWGVFKQDDDFNRSESKHEYLNGSYLDFLGADVSDVGKGFRRDILYINEADKITIDSAVQFISRAKLTIIDYNPDKPFWGDDYINENNFLRLTFEDNEYLSESEVRSILDYKQKGFINPDLPFDKLFHESNIKNKYWSNKWKVYGLGLVGALTGVVFDNWNIVDKIPEHAELKAYGLDYGWSNDPTALTEIWYCDNAWYFNEVIYETGITDVPARFKKEGVKQYVNIFADTNEGRTNSLLRTAGFRVRDAKKGADSVMFGISIMQGLNIFITRRSTNIIFEFNNYIWGENKEGNATNEPRKKHGHSVDGIRYKFQTEWQDPDAPRFYV